MSINWPTTNDLIAAPSWISDKLALTPIISYLEETMGIQRLHAEIAFAVIAGFLSLWVIRRLTRFAFKLAKRSKKSPTTVATKELPLSEAISSVRSGFWTVGYFSLFINLLLLVTPIYMLQVYDRVLTSGSHDTLIYLSVLAVALILVNGVLELARSRLLVRIGARIDLLLSGPVYRSMFSNESLGNRTGVQPITDLAKVRNFLSSSGLNAFFDAPWTPLFIALIFALHPLLGIIAAIGATILLVLAVISELVTRNTFNEASSKSHEAITTATANLRNAEVVKGMGMLDRVANHWQSKNLDSLILQGKGNDRIGLLTSITKTIRPGLQIAMLGSGAYLALEGIISPGVMIAASIILGRALAPVEAAVGQWRTFIAARLSYDRLRNTVYDSVDDNSKLSFPKPTGQLSLENVTLTPTGARAPILNDVSFELEPGEILAIVGPSASGKSTLARALVNIWQPETGHVRLDGIELPQWHPSELGNHLGYLPQDVELFEGTVAENITRFSEIDSQKILKAATLANAHDMILQLPEGYETNIGPQGCILSGGQRQRLGLARALYGDPSLVVLDEPDASLDTDGEQALMESITKLRKNKQTVVVISHRPGILQAVDKVMILRDGRMVAMDRKERIFPQVVSSKPQTNKNANTPTKRVTLNNRG